MCRSGKSELSGGVAVMSPGKDSPPKIGHGTEIPFPSHVRRSGKSTNSQEDDTIHVIFARILNELVVALAVAELFDPKDILNIQPARQPVAISAQVSSLETPSFTLLGTVFVWIQTDFSDILCKTLSRVS